MSIFVEFAGFIMICYLLIGLFRMIASKAEQFVETFEKIHSAIEINQHIPSPEPTAKVVKKGAKVLAHRNR